MNIIIKCIVGNSIINMYCWQFYYKYVLMIFVCLDSLFASVCVDWQVTANRQTLQSSDEAFLLDVVYRHNQECFTIYFWLKIIVNVGYKINQPIETKYQIKFRTTKRQKTHLNAIKPLHVYACICKLPKIFVSLISNEFFSIFE